MPLVLFPEGARSPDGRLQAAHSGCAFMAIRAGVPLVPLALVGTYELLPIHVYTLRPRPLRIIVGDPIPPRPDHPRRRRPDRAPLRRDQQNVLPVFDITSPDPVTAD